MITTQSSSNTIVLLSLTLLLSAGDIDSVTVNINTDLNSISWSTNKISGTVITKNFTCKNNIAWLYEVSSFTLDSDDHHKIFSSGNKIVMNGSRSLEIKTAKSLSIDTVLNLNGISIRNVSRKSYLGGFAPNNTLCCYVGAGPGAGMTFHGGGHGGDGGGYWLDTEQNHYYGKQYKSLGNLLGGSTGAIVYDSDPGTGGGAISLTVGGKLTIGPTGKILANGFSVPNTSYPACSGGSAGGRIAIRSSEVILQGVLSVDGGSSGITSNYSNYCGDGGGGGVIDIVALDYSQASGSSVSYAGGRGLENGNNGIARIETNFHGKVMINTSKCSLKYETFEKMGEISLHSHGLSCSQFEYKVCLLQFAKSVKFTKNATVEITGENALKIVSSAGDITIDTKFDLSGKEKAASYQKYLGGYHNGNGSKNRGPGANMDNATHGDPGNYKSYGIIPTLLIGGSSCTKNSPSLSVGGGAVYLEASNGEITINASITANGFSKEATGCGASGGAIILTAKMVHLNADLEAKGSDGVIGGDGGVVNISESVAARVNVDGGKGSHRNGASGSIIGPNKVPNPVAAPPCSTLSSTLLSTLSSGSATPYVESTASLSATHTILAASMSVHATKSSPSRILRSSSVHTVRPTENPISPQFRQFLNTTVTNKTALRTSRSLLAALRNSSRMTKEDIALSIKVMEQVANRSLYQPSNLTEARTVTENMVLSCDRIGRMSFIEEKKNNRSYTLAPTLTRILENHGEGIGVMLRPNETFLVKGESFAIEVHKVDTAHASEELFPMSPNARLTFDNVTIPKEVFDAMTGDASVVLVIMKINGTYNNSYTIKDKRVRIASNILAVSIPGRDTKSLATPITLKQKLAFEVKENMNVSGGFWLLGNKKKRSPGWSYRGCTSTPKGGYVETKCNHMTSFAVLMSVKQYEIPDVHKKALSYITYIGCGISLFGLLLTFATFVTLDNLDAERTAIHTNLVVALGLAQIIFLAGIGATENKAACTTVAILLHYFFTAAFSWMLAEGMHLYNKVVSVFTHGSKMKFYYVIGWGLPIIIVALAAGIKSDGYGTSEACWISIKGGLIWAFVAPVLVVIIINFVVLVIVVKILMSSVSTVQVDTSSDSKKSALQIKAGAKAMVILMPILGLSWLFGILSVNSSTITFQYLFCIFNSLQGLFIFLIHCIGNTEVRSAFKRLHEKHTLSKSFGEKSTGNKSIGKNESQGDNGREILVRRRTNSSQGSCFDESRTVTPKTLSAGQISLNSLHSLHCPTPNEGFDNEGC